MRRVTGWMAVAWWCASGVGWCGSSVLLVLSKRDHEIEMVDPAAGRIIARMPSGEDPHEIAASPDGTRAYVSNYGGPRSTLNTISVADLTQHHSLTPISLGPLHGAHGLFFAGGKLYFTAETNKVIGRWDPDTRTVDWVMGTGLDRTHMVFVTPALDRIYTSNIESDSIGIFHRAPGNGPWTDAWHQTVVPVGKGPEGFDVSPDGKQLWAANSHDGSISMIDLATERVIGRMPDGTSQSNRLKFTPDGKHVFVSDLRTGDLVVVDVAARRVVRRLKLGQGAAGILMSPERNCAYVAVGPNNHLAVIDLATLEVKGQIATGGDPDGMAWVPGS